MHGTTSAERAGWIRFTGLRALLNARAAQWMRRRQGEDHLPVTLERRRLYILPTRVGVAFAALLFLMLLAGLNYTNSLALFLTFLLAGFALVVMQQCHRNLLGTEVAAATAPAVFARSTGTVQLILANGAAAPRPGLEAALVRGAMVTAELPAGARQRLELPVPAPRRGLVRLERVRLSSAWPFGLFRVWTWVHTPITMLVYPHPHGSLPMPVDSARLVGARSRSGAGGDEWAGLRPFRDGDSPRQVDWKAYAREAPLLVKEYVQGASDLRLFEFEELRALDQEGRLSQLARWVVDAEAQGERYGLVLPGLQIAPDRGPEHRHRCLAALALFDLEGTSA
ncbi:MAG: DUF58 domain-containing protein [Gammaproteobacteria bacterium]|nr:DUF58 domain-containing protein [Gammaproteobacteria bacterium]